MQRKVLIVGHTDERDVESGVHLATLSQQRAKAVAALFAKSGVPARNIYYQGAGDTLPIANNATAEGRQENQRVQIVDVPNTTELKKYLSQRTANAADFQVAVNTHARYSSRNESKNQESTSNGHKQQTSPQPPTHASRESSLPHESVHSAASTEQEGAGAVPRKPANESRQSETQNSSIYGYNFGGTPTTNTGTEIDLGEPAPSHSMFSIISTAQAGMPVHISSCLRDKPHGSTDVRNLATGEELAPRNYVPGFDNNVWASDVHGNLVAIIGATIPLDTGAPVPTPKILIYKNYSGNPHQRPSFKTNAPINVYRGAEKTLYRVFVRGPAQCIDLVVPTRQFNGNANLYYTASGLTYSARLEFAVQR